MQTKPQGKYMQQVLKVKFKDLFHVENLLSYFLTLRFYLHV